MPLNTADALERLRQVCIENDPARHTPWIETVAYELDRRAERIMELELDLELAQEKLAEAGLK